MMHWGRPRRARLKNAQAGRDIAQSALKPAACSRLSCQPSGPGLHQAEPRAAATQPKSGRKLTRRIN